MSITLPERHPGIGFVKMEIEDHCMKVIDAFNGQLLDGARDPLKIKFADDPQRQRVHDKIYINTELI